MKVKLNTIMAGPDCCVDAGATIEVPDPLGRELVKGGYAIQVAAPGSPQTATASAATAETNELAAKKSSVAATPAKGK